MAEFLGNGSCSAVHNYNFSERCAFVQATSDCQFEDGFIQYITKVYCANSETDSVLILIAMFFWCLLMLLLLATVADEFFGPALVVIAKLLRLSDNLAGVTLLALGNGAADIFSAIAAAKTTTEGDAGLIYGSLLGAGILVTTVTTACVALAKPFRTQRRPILKDIIFYIIAVVWNFTIMWKGYIHFAEALGFIILYVLYVGITVASRYVRNRMLRKKQEEEEKEEKQQPPTPKISRKAKVHQVPDPCQPQLQLTRFKRRSDDDDLGATNLAYTPDLQLPQTSEAPNGTLPKRLSPRPSPLPSPGVSRAPSAASSMRYDDTMGHGGLQRVEGVAIRRKREINRGSSKTRSISQYHGLTKKLSMRNQMLSNQLGVPVQPHYGPRPSYLTQWVMAYRQEDDNAMIPPPDPRDMKRQRSRSHLEIQRDVDRMNLNKGRARSVTFDSVPVTMSNDVERNRSASNRKNAGNGSFVEISLADLNSDNKRKSSMEAVRPVRKSGSTIVSPEPGPAEVDVDFENEEEEDQYQVPGFWMHFLETVNPLDVHVWQSLTLFWKLFELIRCPIRFLLTLLIPLVDCDHPTKGWCKLLVMLQCFITPIFWTLATKVFTEEIGGVMPVWGLLLILGSLFAGVVFFTSKHDEPPKYHFVFAIFGFATSIIWIYSVTNEVVNILPTYGVVFSISRAVLALTFLAWANSVGDIMSNTILARNNFPRIAISACFGGPLFNLLLGLGIPFTMLTAGGNFRSEIQISMVQVILVIFLLFTLFSHLVLLFLFRFNVKRYYGVYFIVVYIVFVTVAILSELSIIPSFV